MNNSKNVVINDIIKIYPGQKGKQVIAVDNVSLEIKSGEFITLLGPSGCGKTTILRMIAGFEMPTNGDIYIGGERVNNLTPDKRDTAMVFQSYALFPHLSVFENIAYGLKIKNFSQEDIKNKVENILNIVGLTGLESRAPNQLSGGQQQRVALARSLVMEPSVLLFDEPLSNLDAKLRVYMRSEIRRIQQKIGITSIYVTHDQAEAMSMSDRVIVMNKGVIEQIGSPQEIYAKPASQFVADFIGLANIVDAQVDDIVENKVKIKLLDTIFEIEKRLDLKIGDTVKVVLRPEAMSVGKKGKVSGIVEASVFMGAYQDYKISIGKHKIMVIDYNPLYKETYKYGDQVFVDINESSIHTVSK